MNVNNKEKELIISILKSYPRNMREPFETNYEFNLHISEVDNLLKKLEAENEQSSSKT